VFVSVGEGDRVRGKRLSGDAIGAIVKRCATATAFDADGFRRFFNDVGKWSVTARRQNVEKYWVFGLGIADVLRECRCGPRTVVH
jgi:hypothetical protein